MPVFCSIRKNLLMGAVFYPLLKKEEPVLREVLPGHFVACHRVEDMKKEKES